MSTQILVQHVAREAIAQKIRETQRGLILYNPETEWREINALGGTVLLPPDLDGKLIQHPRRRDKKTGDFEIIRANGQAQVFDRFGKKRTKKGKEQIVKMEGQSALEIVQHIVAKHPEIAYLSGDKEEDARAKQQAKLNLAARRKTWAQRTWDPYVAYIQKFRVTNPGQEPVAPTATQQRAKEFLDDNENVQPWKTFVCRTCYFYQSDEFDGYQKHMQKKHNVTVNPPGFGGKVELDLQGEEVPTTETPAVIGGQREQT